MADTFNASEYLLANEEQRRRLMQAELERRKAAATMPPAPAPRDGQRVDTSDIEFGAVEPWEIVGDSDAKPETGQYSPVLPDSVAGFIPGGHVLSSGAGGAVGVYHDVTGQTRGKDEALVRDFEYRFSDRLGEIENKSRIKTYQDGSIDHASFIQAAREAYMRRKMFQNHGTMDASEIPDDAYRAYNEAAFGYAYRELDAALNSGALFSLPDPTQFDTFSSRVQNANVQELGEGAGWVVRAGGTTADAATWFPRQVASHLVNQTKILLPEAVEPALDYVASPLTTAPSDRIPAQAIDDPIGYSALVLDTMIASTTPYGRRTMGGEQYQWARPEMGGQGTASMILRPLSALPTSAASMLSYHRTDVDPRVWAAEDRMMMEEGYARGKAAGEEYWGEGHWGAAALGYLTGVGGLLGDVVIPGGPVEGGLVAAGRTAKTAKGLKVVPGSGAMDNPVGAALWSAMEKTGATPTSWALENLASSMDSLGTDYERALGLAREAEAHLGPGVSQHIERAYAGAAVGSEMENIAHVQATKKVAYDHARSVYTRLSGGIEDMNALPKGRREEVEKAYNAMLQAQQEYDEVSEALQIVKKAGAAPSQYGTATQLPSAKAKLTTARDEMLTWDTEAIAEAAGGGVRYGDDAFVSPRASQYRQAKVAVGEINKAVKANEAALNKRLASLADTVQKRSGKAASRKALDRTLTSNADALKKWASNASDPKSAGYVAKYTARDDILQRAMRGDMLLDEELAILTKDQRRRVRRWYQAESTEEAVQAVRDFVANGSDINASKYAGRGGEMEWITANAIQQIDETTRKNAKLISKRGGAMGVLRDAEQELVAMRDAMVARIDRRLADLEQLPRKLADHYRDLAHAYRASNGKMRPPTELLEHIVQTTSAKDVEQAEDLLAAMEDIMRVAADPQSWKLGVRGLKGWATRTRARMIRRVDPIVERHGDISGKSRRAMEITENVYRATQSETLSLLTTHGRDPAEKMAVLDRWMDTTDPIRYGGKFQGVDLPGLRWTEKLSDTEKGAVGATMSNAVILGDGVKRSPWDVVRMKFQGADLDGFGLGALADQNPDLQGFAYMWVGAKQVDDDAKRQLVARAMNLMRDEAVDTAAKFREEMRKVTTQLGIAPDIREHMVAYRQAVASAWTASTMRGLELLDEAIGTSQTATRMNDLLQMARGNYYKAANIAESERVASRMGVPILPRGSSVENLPADPEFVKAIGNVTVDQPHWVSAATAKRWGSYAEDFVKATDRYTPSAMRSYSTLLYQLWKRSVVAGLIMPDPGYGFQNILGDWSQMALQFGVVRATSLSFQNLSSNIPVLNRHLARMAVEHHDAMKGVPVLGSVFNAIMNPNLHKVLRGHAGQIVVEGGKRKGTRISFDELRRWTVEEGVLSTFESTEGLADLVRGTSSGAWGRVKSWADAIGTHADVVAKNQRAALFLEEMRMHGDPARAGKVVRAALYDYANFVTDWERNSIGVISPFWSFWKNSLNQNLSVFTELYENPTLGRMIDGRFSNVRKMEALKRMLANSATSDEDKERDRRLDYQNAFVSGWMANRAKFGFQELSEKEAEFYLKTLGRDVDSTVHILPPDGYQDTMEVIMAPMALLVGMIYEADKAMSGGVSNMPYQMGAGWERYAIEPVSSLLGPLVAPMVMGWAENMGMNTGAYGLGEYTRVHPALIAVENAGAYEWFTDSDQDGKVKMKTWAAAMIRNMPVMNELLLTSKNMWFENAGRAHTGTAMERYLAIMREAGLGALRVQARPYSAGAEHQRWMDEISRELSDRKSVLGGASRWESRPDPNR